MYHFFVTSDCIADRTVRIGGSDFNHIKNVLRMQPGEELTVSNGENTTEYHCRVTDFEADEVLCEVMFVKEAGAELPTRVYLFQGMPKADKMELIIQKAVELGVYEVIPVACRRCVVKLDDKKEETKIKRWNTISEAAAKQSQRGIVPKVSGVMSMKQAVEYAIGVSDQAIIPYELAERTDKTAEIFSALSDVKSIAVFIGPEGGFEESEVKMCEEAGIVPISLGKRILRTETAGIVVLSWIGFQTEINTY